MDSYKLSLKFFADGAAGLASDAVIRVFHELIRDQAIPDHLLIDVTDYAHVPDGPGTVLVAHEANIHFDHSEGRPGLLYIRKQPIAGASTFHQRLTAVFRSALQAAVRLQFESSLDVRFRTDEVVLRIHDRLLAPNTEATFAGINSELQAFLAELYQGDIALQHVHDPLRLFEVRIRSTARPAINDLLTRLGSQAAAAPAR